jgi:glycerol-3-phosphate dehydrogenase (NAD(P)+)
VNVVFGTGSWGTTLALVLARQATPVTLLARDRQEADALALAGENTRFLPGFPFPPSLTVACDLRVLAGAEVVILAVPSSSLPEVMERLGPSLPPTSVLVSGSKGLVQAGDQVAARRPTEVISAAVGNPVCALSGPNLAREVARALPSTTVVASRDRSAAEAVQRLFTDRSFRVYTSSDMVGVELAGALKNVVALAAGAADGMQLGDNAKAALITRGLAEMSRLGRELGAEPLTFAGLAGLGDLVATCASPLSRNRRLGEALAAGRNLAEAQREIGQLAEGVPTTRAAVELARRHNVDMPIAQQMHAVLFEGKDPRQAVLDLMQREPKAELG